jgi:hypothetical protein
VRTADTATSTIPDPRWSRTLDTNDGEDDLYRAWSGAAATAAATAEVAARLTISHVVLPLHPPDVVADQIATTVVRLLM